MSLPTMRVVGIVDRTSSSNGMNHANKVLRSGVDRPRAVYVVKDQYPVSLVKLAQFLDVAG